MSHEVFVQQMIRQMVWSRAVFGPGARQAGCLDHIRSELKEIEEPGQSNAHLSEEWTDLLLLTLDGFSRHLREIAPEAQEIEQLPYTILSWLRRKQKKNEERDWPAWQTADPDKGIHHIKEDSE